VPTTWTGGTPRKHTQNARDFTRKHNAARKASEHDFPKADKDIIDHPDTDLYMDPSGQAGLAVAPDGELTHVFSVEDASPHARTYIDELISEAQIDGKVGHAITEAAENTTQTSHLIRSGFVPVARAEGKVYWVSANKVSDVGRLADDIVDLADASQAFDYMFAIMDGGPPSKSRLNYRAAEGEHWPPGVQYLYDEDSFYQFHADLDPSFADEIGLLTPEQQAAIRRIEFDLRRQQKHGFTLRKAPQDVQGASYFEGQGDLIDELFGAERMLEDRMFAKPFIAAKQVWDRMFNPVFSREMMDQQGQFLLDELVQQGFSAGEVNAFVAELNSTWKAMPTLPGGTHMFRQPGAMTPNTIRRVAQESLPGEVLNKMMAGGDDIVDLLQRVQSRSYRALAREFSGEGQGKMGALLDHLYGASNFGAPGLTKGTEVARRGSYILRTGYHVFRFLADPRWVAMNLFEADIMALLRSRVVGPRRWRAHRHRGRPELGPASIGLARPT
jgi:hypothetical protein